MALWNRDLASNEVSLRMLVGGADWMSAALMRERMPLYLLGVIGCVALVVVAARGRALEDAMLLALPLILVLMNPVNYHGHLVFLLVLLGARPGLLASAAPWLLIASPATWVAQDPERRPTLRCDDRAAFRGDRLDVFRGNPLAPRAAEMI